MTANEMGRKGGMARAKSLTRAQRVASAKKAIAARWKKYRAAQKEKSV